MPLKFYEVDDPSIVDITVDHYAENCLLVPKGFQYRGQGDASWPLIPSAFRDASGAAVNSLERTRRIRYFSDEQFEIDFKRLVDLAGPEEKVQASDKTGYKKLLMLTFFQHFGLPTPLLDWTSSPLIALFMSLFERPSSANGIAIYRLNPLNLTSDVTFQQYNKISFRRIQTQVGGVLFFGQCTENSVDLSTHIFDEYINMVSPSTPRFVQKLKIAISGAPDVQKIQDALTNNGFREDMIFPNSMQWAVKQIKEKMK